LDPILRFTIIGSISLLFLIVIAIILSTVFKKNRLRKMYNHIEEIFKSYVKDHYDYKFEVAQKSLEYDYLFETTRFKYYIKIVPNFNNQEITVNNSVKWQLRKSFNDESLRFVNGIEPLMRLELPTNEDNKINKKLYIVYPNARSLLKYINECEMEFVHADTDVYGTNIITYVNLKENRDIIEF